MDLYWFMPALVNRRVGSERGTTDEDGTVPICKLYYGQHQFVPRTECMAILLEVVQEGLSNAAGRPLLLTSMRRHFEVPM
jgi:hypothetical protein